MLELPEPAIITNVAREKRVRANLVRLTRELAAKEIDGSWWKIDVSKRSRQAEDDHHWVWRKLIGEIRSNLAWEAMAIQSQAGRIEGAMTFRIDAKSQLSPGDGAIFVDRLATAPRNRPWLVKSPKYRGVGKNLLLAAVRQSYLLGLGGRVWLSSLPAERTRQFYRKRGFQEIFEDEDGMIDFELPTKKAEQWLRQEGYLT